jgi:hypothetical protein
MTTLGRTRPSDLRFVFKVLTEVSVLYRKEKQRQGLGVSMVAGVLYLIAVIDHY